MISNTEGTIIILLIAAVAFVLILLVRNRGEMVKQIGISALIMLGFVVVVYQFATQLHKLPLWVWLSTWLGLTSILEIWRWFNAPRKPHI